MNNIKKILMVLIVLVIVAGIAMICIKGFNYSLLFSNAQRLNIYMTQDFNINDINEIVKEVLGSNKFEVQLSNTFGTVVSIISKEITDEQQNNIIAKINEKYAIEINKDSDVILANIPQANILDLVVKYIAPIVITTIVVLLYFTIRFRREGILKCIVIPIISLIIVEALYVSIVALTRIPVNEFFAIFGVVLYLLTILCNTIKLSRKTF